MFSVEEIMPLMDKLAQTGLQSVKIQEEDCSVCITAKKPQVVEVSKAKVAEASVVNEQPGAAEETKEKEQGKPIKSPIVGTFYEAPSPDKPPFVKVGQKVKKGDVLFIIESMKLMNEVISESDGVITKICVENNSPVEYGQVIMYME